MPSGTLELVVNLEHDEIFIVRDGALAPARFSGAVVSGAYGRSFVIDARAHRSMVGVHFRPGGAASFLGMPALELADAHVDLATLWGADGRRVRDGLCAAGSTRERFDRLEAALRVRLADRYRRPFVRAAVEKLSRSDADIGALVRESGLSHRRFVELFAAQVGVSPKRFGRIARFQRVLASAHGTARGWARIAREGGYADQPHLIRDFTEFAGITPTAYLRLRSEELVPNHLLADPSISSKRLPGMRR